MERLSRREALLKAGCGFGYLAFSAMAGAAGYRSDPMGVRPPMYPARAKRVIFLYMQGGPSQVDTFDFKPELARRGGTKVPFRVPRTRKVTEERVFGPLWEFSRHGESGRLVSSLFPEVSRHVDDLCFLHGMHTEGVAHGPATLFLHTGATNLVRPSVGSWISYGLGAANENLPAFVTVNPPATKGGPRNYGNAFLPALHQGTVLGQTGNPNAKPEIRHVADLRVGAEAAGRRFGMLQEMNREQLRAVGGGEPELEAAIQSYELAWRLQNHAPAAVDVDGEDAATLEMYGIGKKETDGFGRQCLAARQLAEAGVRYIQVSHCDNSATPVWDQHSGMPKHADRAREVDRPIAGLLEDLKRRGLLEDTLVWWGSEFGRTPFAQGKDGRDHNPLGFTVWLAGGGVKPGYAHGATDEFGFQAVEGKVHMHDLHATVLHLLGMDHERLTFRYAGRDFRLTDVSGNVVREIIA